MKQNMDKNSKKKNHTNGKYKKNGKSEYRPEDDPITTCCLCIKTNKNQKKSMIAGFVTNLGIFVLLLCYTLLGAFIFLAIEGNAANAKVHQKTLATTSYQVTDKKIEPIAKLNGSINQASAELRSQTVESIWEITVSLNILYKENWTRLAAQEIARFQEKLVARVAADVSAQYSGARALESAPALVADDYEWNFAKAFLYSLTVLTTIGYGSVAPRTALGKAVTIGYAVIGIPLTLLYLSVVGALLSRVARSIFSRTLCCLCSKHCCLDERTLSSKERKEKSRRHDDIRGQLHLQEPYYVRSPSGTIISASQAHTISSSSIKDKNQGLGFLRDCDSLSCTDTDSKVSLRRLSLLPPVGLCLVVIFSYIFLGALVLYHMEGWSPIDGVYFCFMSLSTIGFGHLAPGATHNHGASTGTVWFCSVYIITGLALTAMCFNVLHDEIVHRLRHHDKIFKATDQKMFTPEYLHRS